MEFLPKNDRDRSRLLYLAIGIFLLVTISTFPLVIPFLLMNDPKLALRISNAIAILMMFLCGWSVARYVGYNKWKMSIAMVLIGLAMVAVTNPPNISTKIWRAEALDAPNSIGRISGC